MTRRHRRGRILLALALCAALAGSAAGLVLHSRAQPAAATGSTTAPVSARDRAQLHHMQALLNSGSVHAQSALLVPPARFAPGSGPVLPAGTTVRVLTRTFHPAGQFGTVRARMSSGGTVTLDLYLVRGHWHLYDAVQGSAQTKAKVTGEPIKAQLMSANVGKNNTCPTTQDINGPEGRLRTPVILVHGFGEKASNWSDGGAASMFAKVSSVPGGVWVSAFDYEPTNKDWVDNQENGPALANYIHCVAQASSTGKVVIVAFSMGGLLTRYAATIGGQDGSVAGDIGMVVTIGTPNEGTMYSNGAEIVRRIVCQLHSQSDACTKQTAFDGMSVFGPGIRNLPELPPSIPLHAIAGDETYVATLWGAHYILPLFGDGIVNTWSALHKPPGSMNDTFDTVKNPLVPGDVSVWHLWLKRNAQVQQLVYTYINTYLQANPPNVQPAAGDHCLIYQPEDQQASCQPSIVTGYWMTGQGQWTVHGGNLRISPGPPADTIAQTLYGTETWNAGGQVILGHARLTFVTQPDGSLAGTYTGDAWYTQSAPQPASSVCSSCNFQPPSPPEMLAGQTITLVPVAPGLAKTTYNSDSVPPWPASYADGTGNPYWCGAALAVANPSQYCGA